MPTYPLISIIVPAYNAGAFLDETLSSVRAQTYPHFEVWVVDDGSTDDTAQIARRFSAEDSRFHLLCQSNSGVSAARNLALEMSAGTLIAFLDADDVWLPEKLELQVQALNNNPGVNFIYSNYLNWDRKVCHGIRYGNAKKLPKGNVYKFAILYCPFGISTVLVRRNLLESVGLFDTMASPAEDWDMWLRMARKAIRPLGIFAPLARYRIWPGSASRNIVRMQQAELFVLQKNQIHEPNKNIKRLFKLSILKRQAKQELYQAGCMIDTQPEEVADAIWRAWRRYPSNIKWLFRWALAAWPRVFGGNYTATYVHRKLRQKF